MTPPRRLRLKKDEERRIRAGHLWVFSNEVDVDRTPLRDFSPGEPAILEDSRGNPLGAVYVNPHSLICARLYSRDPRTVLDERFLGARISAALALRETLFPGEPYYRLVFGEGDGLPGLLVDRYGDVLVTQVTTAGMQRVWEAIENALVERTRPQAIVQRNDLPARSLEGLDSRIGTTWGSVAEPISITENGVAFEVPVLSGQKTGWFFDHRHNRLSLRPFVAGGRVLDVFAYLGAWGVQAAVWGAERVVCVDSSGGALEGLARNAALNGVAERVEPLRADAFEALERLRAAGERFDVVVLDPPAFVKRRKDLEPGQQAYRRLNRLAISLVAPGGVLVSASCSFHLERAALLRAVLWAARRADREIQVLESRGQAPDHPVHPAIPETAYLKCFVTRVLD